jgi:nucleoid DNA-binding protein
MDGGNKFNRIIQMRYTKKDIVKTVAGLSKFRKKDIQKVVNAIFFTLRSLLEQSMVGDKIIISDFGKFYVKERKFKKEKFSELTGKRYKIPPRRIIYFKPSRKLNKKLKPPAIEIG